jgi:hypothetical protein
MKKTLLVLMSVISVASIASNTANTVQVSVNSSSKKILEQKFLLATTVNSAKNSAVTTQHVAQIAKTVTANIG